MLSNDGLIWSGSRNFNGTDSRSSFSSTITRFAANTPHTVLALIRPTGSGEGGLGHIFSRVASAATTGIRFYVIHNAGSPALGFGLSSSGTASAPLHTATAGTLTYGNWQWVAAKHDGSLNGSGIRLYSSDYAEDTSLAEVSSYNTTTNGSGSLSNPTEVCIVGNRTGLDRTFLGDIALIWWWREELTDEELETAKREGPFLVRPDALNFAWTDGVEQAHGYQPSNMVSMPAGQEVAYTLRPGIPFPLSGFPGAAAQTIVPGGITSLESFGTTVVSPGAVFIVPSAIDSLEAFGAATVSQGAVSIVCSGIASLETFGAHTVTPGAVTLLCSGIASLEAFGSHVISAGGSVIVATGIDSLEAFGSHTLTPGAVTITCDGIASAEAFGAHAIGVSAQFVAPAAIVSLEAFGSHTLTPGSVAIVCGGIASAEAFGAFSVSGGEVTQLNAQIILVAQSENRVLLASENRIYRVQ